MIKLLKHGINLIRHSLRDVGVSAKRSGKWPTVEKHFLEQHPECEACGSKTRLNVHHIKPFHEFPKDELDPTNLITLCMSRKECHLQIGHIGDFKKYNSNVVDDCAKIRKHPDQEKEIIADAKARK